MQDSPIIEIGVTAILLFIIGFGLPIFMLPETIDGSQWYAQIYNSTLGHTYYKQNVKPTVDKLFGGSLRLFSVFVFGEQFHWSTVAGIFIVIAGVALITARVP